MRCFPASSAIRAGAVIGRHDLIRRLRAPAGAVGVGDEQDRRAGQVGVDGEPCRRCDRQRWRGPRRLHRWRRGIGPPFENERRLRGSKSAARTAASDAAGPSTTRTSDMSVTRGIGCTSHGCVVVAGSTCRTRSIGQSGEFRLSLTSLVGVKSPRRASAPSRGPTRSAQRAAVAGS